MGFLFPFFIALFVALFYCYMTILCYYFYIIFSPDYKDKNMGLFHLLLLLIIAAICGSIGMALAGFNQKGCIISVVVGFIGALLGTWLSRELNLPDLITFKMGDGKSFPIIWSIIGALIFSLPLSFLVGKRK